MWGEIVVALITAGLALVGTIITVKSTVKSSSEKTQTEVRTELAIVKTEIKELTRETREHNNFAKRMPVVEEQIKGLSHRVEDLEKRIST